MPLIFKFSLTEQRVEYQCEMDKEHFSLLATNKETSSKHTRQTTEKGSN